MHHRARAWLAQRAGAVPPSLEARMERAVDDVAVDAADIPGALARAALRCLEEAVRLGDERAAAWPLLAADALMTAACEAASDAQTEVRAFTRRFAPADLALLTTDDGEATT